MSRKHAVTLGVGFFCILGMVLSCIVACSVPEAYIPSPVGIHFKKDYQVRNFFNSSVVLSQLDFSEDVLDEWCYPRIHKNMEKVCDFSQKGRTLTLSNSRTSRRECLLQIGKLYNYAAVDLDISEQSHKEYMAKALLCFYKDYDNRIVVIQRDVDSETKHVSVEVFKNGENVFAERVSEGIATPNTLRVHITGAYLNVLSVKDGEWSLLGSMDISPYFDLRDKEVLGQFTVAAGARLGKGESLSITKLEHYLTSGTAQADPKVIHYENGAPMIEGNKIWVAMTTRGYGPIPSSYQGVYSYDLQTQKWEVTAVLTFNQGDGILRPWHASDIFFDRTDQKWKVFTVSHGDDHKIYQGESVADLRSGYHEIASKLVDYPSVGNEEDPSVVFDSDAGKWRMAVCKNNEGYQTVLLEADTWNGTWTQIAVYESVSSTGALIQKIGGERYVFIGRGETPCPFEVLSYPALQKVGELDLSEHPDGQNVWPVIIPITYPQGTSYHLLTFDRSGLFPGWSYGNLHWYSSEKFANGFYEYENEKSAENRPAK